MRLKWKYVICGFALVALLLIFTNQCVRKGFVPCKACIVGKIVEKISSKICVEECVSGEMKCVGYKYYACGNYDADPCLEEAGKVGCMRPH